MATGTGNAIGQVFGLGEVLRLQAGLVALKANGRGLRRAQSFKADDLRDIATAIDMSLCWTVARLATMFAIFQQG